MRDPAEMGEELACAFLRVAHLELAALPREQRAAIALLAAGFRIEWRLIDEDRGVGPGLCLIDRFTIDDDRHDLAFGDMGFIAKELGRAQLLAQLEPDSLGRGLESGICDLAAAPAQHVLRQIERETKRVVELERDLAGEILAGLELAVFLVEQAQPALERLFEIRLFEPQRLGDE